jgi:hypothetical protein
MRPRIIAAAAALAISLVGLYATFSRAIAPQVRF